VFFWDNEPVPKRRLLILIVVLVLVALGAAAYAYFRPQITDWIASITGEEEKGKEEGEETGEEVICEGQIYTNARQGYTVCYPSGWYTRDFGYSQQSVGFDFFPIPEASEYAGVFTISISRQNSATLLSQYLEGLEGASTTAVTIDGVSGIRIQGVFPSDDNFFPNYRQIAVVMEKFGRTYTILMLSSPDGYEGNQLLYDAFVASMRFLDGTAAAPWGRDIYLEAPWPDDEVSGSFRIAGSAQGAFENTIVARLKTAGGTVLFQIPIIYNAPEMGELGYFDVPVTFSTSRDSGTLEVYHTSAMDGSILDIVSIPLTFR
jgi:hypothetical protein